MKRYLAEMTGTMVLVLIGCGSAIFNGGCGTPAQVAMAYTIGGISGCHINPAITLGVMLSGRMKTKDGLMYMLFQVAGAVIGSAILYLLTSCIDIDYATRTGANVCQPGVGIAGGFIAELVFTFIFVLVVLGTTDASKGAGNFAGLAIGLSLVMIHIVCIPITGTSVNPARSIGPAIFEGGAALAWSMISEGLVDEHYIFVAPKISGGENAKCPVGGAGFDKMRQALQVDVESVTQSGTDWLFHCFPADRTPLPVHEKE